MIHRPSGPAWVPAVPEGERCGSEYPDPRSGPCVFRVGHRGMHKDAGDGWWSDEQARERSESLVHEVMSS